MKTVTGERELKAIKSSSSFSIIKDVEAKSRYPGANKIKEAFPVLEDAKFTLLEGQKQAKFSEEFVALEKKLKPRNYKFGVLNLRGKQSKENEIYANLHSNSSKHYLEFLEIIGEKVRLKGFDKYKGGLNITDDTTGEFSIYTQVHIDKSDGELLKQPVEDISITLQVMFHVATLLPFEEGEDSQQLQRKRHVGNDIVVLVFIEPNAGPLDPTILTSQFNHVFIAVQPLPNLDNKDTFENYLLQICYKTGVKKFEPETPPNGIIHKKDLREFLLAKMINAERSVLEFSKEFVTKEKRTIRSTLQGMKKNFDE